MKKLLLFSSLIFLLSISIANAVGIAPTNSDTVLYYGFDTSIIGADDYTPNNNDGTIDGSTFTSNGIISGAYDYDGSNDYTNIYNDAINSSSSFSVSLWVKADDVTTQGRLFHFGNDDAISDISIFMISGSTILRIRDSAGSNNDFTHSSISTGTWYHYVITYNESTKEYNAYADSSSLGTTKTISGITPLDNTYSDLGRRAGATPTYYFNGIIDELAIFNTVLTSDNIDFLYNSGTPSSEQQYPFSTNVTINDSTEFTVNVKQVGSVAFSNTMTTIVSSTLNVTRNETPVYGSYTFNVESNNNNDMYCELVVEGEVWANITRSQTTGDLGTAYIQFPVRVIDNGSYTQALKCQKTSGSGLITISNAVGIGHFLYDQDNNTLPYNSTNFTTTVSSGSSFTLIDSFNITIGNKTEVDESQNRTNHLVVEGSFEYKNNAGSPENLMTYLNINGTNCTIYPRYVGSGSTGSVGVDCILQNVTEKATYTVNVYGNGTNANYTANIVAKNFFMTPGEIVGGTGVITGYTFSGIGYQAVFNSTGGNFNHDQANAFIKLSYSILTDADTTVSFYVVVSDGQTFTTDTWSRDFTAGETGVIIGQDFIESLPKDPNYNITLFTNCGTVGANCTIVGGSSLGYMTDVITTVLNAFNVSAFDYWDNSSISNFTVIDGGIYNTTTGSVLVFTENNPENLTITSDNYFSTYVLNHNSSNDINVTLKQSDIKFSVTELITGISLTDFFFTIDGVTLNSSESFYLKAGSYNVTANNTDYFDLITEINITPLQNNTINLPGAFNGILNISVRDRINLLDIQNFTGYYQYELLGLNFSLGNFATTNYSVSLPVVDSFNYFVDLNPIQGLSSFGDNAEFTVNPKQIINYTFLLYTNNSINYTFKELATGDLLLQNVNISMVGSTVTYNFNTSTGFLYVDDLNDDTYKTTFTTSGYDPVVLYLTLSNNGHLDSIVSFDSGLVSKTFNVQDNNLNPLADATVTFSVNINGTLTVFGQTKTDFSGTSTILLNEDKEYTFIAQKPGYNTFTGSVTPTESSYTITLISIGEDIFTSVFDDVVYTPLFNYDPVTGLINSTFIVSSSEGSLEFFGLYTDYNGSRELFNLSTSPQGGTANILLYNITDPVNRTIVISYFFKSSGYDLFLFNQSYYLSNVTGSNISLTGGLFQPIQDLDDDEPIRGFIGALILLAGVLIFMGATRNFSIGVIGGLIGVGVNYWFGIWPAALSIITFIIGIIILIADNTRG